VASVQTFRFRPRYRGLAFASLGLGGALAVVAIAVLGAAVLPLGTGVLGVALGGAYLASPTWRYEIVVDDAGLEVRTPSQTRVKLVWGDVVEVVASPSTHTCFVDGGRPERSVLVPGVGAPAPYDIADKAALYDAIVAHVDPAKVKTVERLDLANAQRR
jgi:hypothetical protein